jgi:hypothetical protein
MKFKTMSSKVNLITPSSKPTTVPTITDHIIISDDDMIEPKELQKKFDEKFTSTFASKGDSKIIGELIKGAIPHMDKNNKKAAQVMVTQGVDEAVKYMFQHPKEKVDGKPRQMSYGEMRMHYG